MTALRRVETQLGRYDPFLELPSEVLGAVVGERSGWSIAAHLDHSLKVTRVIAASIGGGKAIEGPGISMLGRAVLLLGYIPRGKAKSPEALVGMSCGRDELRELRRTTGAELAALAAPFQESGSKLLVRHPRFGLLTAKEGLRFAEVHTAHHLKIAREILAVQRRQ